MYMCNCFVCFVVYYSILETILIYCVPCKHYILISILHCTDDFVDINNDLTLYICLCIDIYYTKEFG